MIRWIYSLLGLLLYLRHRIVHIVILPVTDGNLSKCQNPLSSDFWLASAGYREVVPDLPPQPPSSSY